MRQYKLQRYQKFIIHYILEKQNNKANALSRKNNFVKTREIFNYTILKINKNELVLEKKYKLRIILYIVENNK